MKRKLLKNSLIIYLFSLAIIFSSCKNSTEPELTTGIAYNEQQINSAYTQISQLSNIKSMVVSYKGNIIKEQYWHDGGKDSFHDVRSVTKTVTGILVGIAIEQGFIKSIDQPINDFNYSIEGDFPKDKSAITIKHLLTMTGGFQWDELTTVAGYNNWITSSNQMMYVLNTPLANTPGKVFTYNSAALHLLSIIITKASGMTTKQFAEKYLFEPLGISERNWETDNQGFYNGGAGLQISPYDMVKIGELIRNKGEYNGKRIVSSEWINQSLQFQISVGNVQPFSSGYGYCLWIGQTGSVNYVFANGWGGQFIVIVPSKNLVITSTNGWSGVGSSIANNQWYTTLNVIINQIVPAFN